MADEVITVLMEHAQQLGQTLKELVQTYAPRHLKDAVYVDVSTNSTSVVLNGRVETNQQPIQKYGTLDAVAQEYGSGPNSELHPTGKYTIVPVNHTYLVFQGTNQFAGQVIHTKKVESPGIRPYHGGGYVRPAIEKFRGVVIPTINPDIRSAVNIAIRKSFPGAGRK